MIIVADDLGYSDISPFGGEIPTPNLEELANHGLKLSQFYTAPMSAPTRAMLMTGNTNHQAGMGGMRVYESNVGKDGYEFHLTDRVVTFYKTLMAGKWHLGYTEGNRPADRGFDESFSLLAGGTDHFNGITPLGPRESFHTKYIHNHQIIRSLHDDFYSSEAYARFLINEIKKTPEEQPLFSYLAFTAPHDPIQAPDQWIQKFSNDYKNGYQEIYEKRVRRLIELGFISDKVKLPDHDFLHTWNQLPVEEKEIESKKMQVYAAMVANMDEQIGKVIQTLKDTNRYDHTIIIFMSDNGANPSDRSVYAEKNHSYWHQFNNHIDNIGKKNSFVSIGSQWTEVNNAPYTKYHKTTSAQGGINTSFIISGVNIANKGGLSRAHFNVYDIAPTLYDFAGIYPQKNIKKNKPLDLIGKSFKNYFIQVNAKIPDNTYFGELHNMKAYIKDQWKIRVLESHPAHIAENSQWSLFNLKDDPLEQNDLSGIYPELFHRLLNEYQLLEKKYFVTPAAGKKLNYIGIDQQGFYHYKKAK